MKLQELLIQEDNPVLTRLRKEKLAANKAANKEAADREREERNAAKKEWNKKYAEKNKKPVYDYAKIAWIIIDAVSNSIPDGDPIDIISDKLKKLGIIKDYSYDVGDILDKAVKQSAMLKQHKTYNGYIKDMWQMYIDDIDPEFNDGKNPF